MPRLSPITKILLLSIIFSFLASCSPTESYVKLATGPQGGSWYPLGGAIKTIVENNIEGTRVRVIPGAGIANIKSVLSGKSDIAIANSVSTVDAIKGNPPFDSPVKNICNLGSLYPQYFQIVALDSSNIKSLNQVSAKVLTGQGPGNTADVITRHVLKVNNIRYDDLARVNYGSYTDSVALMKDGNADFFTLGTTIPAGAIMDLASVRKINLLNIDNIVLGKMREINPGYLQATIPGKTYPGQDDDVLTIGYTTHLISKCDLDTDFVFRVLDSIYENLESLGAITKAITNITPENMLNDIGVPLHPGATAWLEGRKPNN